MKPTERSFARRIDLTSLQLFVAVGETGSIGKAAEREFIALHDAHPSNYWETPSKPS